MMAETMRYLEAPRPGSYEDRYFTEGVCPQCHVGMVRINIGYCHCLNCKDTYRSARVEAIFRHYEEPPKGKRGKK
jgi:hypothetical protein